MQTTQHLESNVDERPSPVPTPRHLDQALGPETVEDFEEAIELWKTYGGD